MLLQQMSSCIVCGEDRWSDFMHYTHCFYETRQKCEVQFANFALNTCLSSIGEAGPSGSREGFNPGQIMPL